MFLDVETQAEWFAKDEMVSSDKPLTKRILKEEDLGLVVLEDDGEAGRFLEGGVPASDTSPMKNPLFWGIESCTDDQFLSFQCM